MIVPHISLPSSLTNDICSSSLEAREVGGEGRPKIAEIIRENLHHHNGIYQFAFLVCDVSHSRPFAESEPDTSQNGRILTDELVDSPSPAPNRLLGRPPSYDHWVRSLDAAKDWDYHSDESRLGLVENWIFSSAYRYADKSECGLVRQGDWPMKF